MKKISMTTVLALALAVAGGSLRAEPGFLRAVLSGSSLNVTSDIWALGNTSVVLTPEEVYMAQSYSFPENTTYAFGSYMYMEGGVMYYFGGGIDDYIFVKVDDYEIISSRETARFGRGFISFKESGWHKIDIRVGNGGGPGGIYSNHNREYGVDAIRYAVANTKEWKTFSDPGDGSLFKTENPESGRNFTVLSRNTFTYAICLLENCAEIRAINIPNEDVVIPSEIEGYAVTRIVANAFKEDTVVKSVQLPASLTTIGESAFYGCTALELIDVPDSVTVIGSEAFRHCSKLSTVNLPKQLVTLGAYAFCDCPLLNHVTIPGTVSEIQHEAFAGDMALEDLTLGEGIQTIAYWAFSGCSALRRVEVPVSVKTLGIYYNWAPYPAFDGCSNLRSILFKGPPPANVEYYAGIIGSCGGVFAREYGRQWIQKLGINNFTGYSQNSILSAKVISSKIRENDPTVMDIVYKVTSSQPTVKVRALAFEDGERSFAKVIRPETFIDGTAANVGDSVTANEEHTISWRVSSDWQTRLAKLQVEVFACEGELLPLELMTIPASDAYGKMKVTWNALSESQWMDALYWLYASKDAGLTLEDGVLKEASSGGTLVSGTSVTYATSYWTYYDRDGRYVGYHEEKQPSAPQYVFGKMGYTLIADEVLTYVNDELRLGLSPNGARQYGYKIVP